MENIILLQLYSFFIYLVSGIIIGVFFDIFRILRKSFPTPDFITYIEDILFWILTGAFLLWILFQFTNGEIRIYNIVGLLIGCILYMLSISKYFIKVNVAILTMIKNMVYCILKIVLFPILFILKLLKKIVMPLPFFVINFQKKLFNFDEKAKTKKEKRKNKQRKKDFGKKCRKI